MTETDTRYAVMNLRTSEFCIPSVTGTEAKTNGDAFESRDGAREYIRETTGFEPENSHLRVYTLKPAHSE